MKWKTIKEEWGKNEWLQSWERKDITNHSVIWLRQWRRQLSSLHSFHSFRKRKNKYIQFKKGMKQSNQTTLSIWIDGVESIQMESCVCFCWMDWLNWYYNSNLRLFRKDNEKKWNSLSFFDLNLWDRRKRLLIHQSNFISLSLLWEWREMNEMDDDELGRPRQTNNEKEMNFFWIVGLFAAESWVNNEMEFGVMDEWVGYGLHSSHSSAQWRELTQTNSIEFMNEAKQRNQLKRNKQI